MSRLNDTRSKKIMRTIITAGNGGHGYHSADVAKSATGKYRLIPGTEMGSKTVIRKAIANVNRGHYGYLTSAGDDIPVTIKTRP